MNADCCIEIEFNDKSEEMAHNITLDFTQSQVEFVKLIEIIAKVANFPILLAFITQHRTLDLFDKPTNEFRTFSFREVKRLMNNGCAAITRMCNNECVASISFLTIIFR